MKTRALLLMELLILLIAVGCASVGTTRFVNPDFDFAYVERVAVLPLENLSNDRQAGQQISRLLVTELLASEAVDVVEPGEVNAALGGITNPTAPSSDEIVRLGKTLGVQAIITGTVTQADAMRSGNSMVPVITIDLHMIETETGAPVWAATNTEKGTSIGSRVFGSGGRAMSETMRRSVRDLVRALVG